MKHNFFVRGYFKNRGYEDSAALAKDEIERAARGQTGKGIYLSRRSSFLINKVRPS